MNLRVACVALQQRAINSFEEFTAIITQQLRFAADYKAKLIVFPEYATLSLLSIKNDPEYWVQPYQDFLQTAAQQFQMYIMGGTHLTTHNQQLFNTALFVNPQGTVAYQHKLHATPEEHANKIQHTQQLQIFNTSFGKLAILVCYDIEFPEAARLAAQNGADLLLVPSYTDDRAGHYRVSLCARARCIENQVYVINSPLVGSIPNVRFAEQTFAKAGIYSPCDIPFPADGIVASGEFNQEVCLIADLDLDLLRNLRKNGTVTPIKDARPISQYQIIQHEL